MSCPQLSPCPKKPFSCFLSSSVHLRNPSYSPSDWLLYSLGDWFTRIAPGPSTTQVCSQDCAQHLLPSVLLWAHAVT